MQSRVLAIDKILSLAMYGLAASCIAEVLGLALGSLLAVGGVSGMDVHSNNNNNLIPFKITVSVTVDKSQLNLIIHRQVTFHNFCHCGQVTTKFSHYRQVTFDRIARESSVVLCIYFNLFCPETCKRLIGQQT